MVTRGLVLAVAAIVSCGPILGLDEGTARDQDGGTVIAADACRGWLLGWSARVPFVVEATQFPVRDYQVPLSLDTRTLVRTGALREDGADLRVVADDGVTELPHWVERGVGTEETIVWTRTDVGLLPSRLFLYYGRPDATDTSSMEDVFVRGVIEDPAFDEGGWSALGEEIEVAASTTHNWSAQLGDGRAWLRHVRPGDAAHVSNVGICQTMLFPAGSQYRLVFDVDVALADRGAGQVVVGGFGAAARSAYGTPTSPGVHRAQETSPIAPGLRTLCFGVFLQQDDFGQGVELAYSKLRLRRWVDVEPKSGAAGSQERQSCP